MRKGRDKIRTRGNDKGRFRLKEKDGERKSERER